MSSNNNEAIIISDGAKNYDYDKIESTYDEDDFINKSETNMKKVGIDYEYDKKQEYAGENFINKSDTNWEYIQ